MAEQSGPQRLRYRTLVVLQPTTFCNIDCSYCYLTERGSSNRMSPQVQRAAFERVLSSELVQDPVVFLWHLGEPLSVPPRFYEEAFATAAEVAQQHGRSISHGFQTNATLVNEAWVELIRRHRVKVGVSIDGPAFIHDRVRVDRKGRGTHADVMRGVRLLQQAGIGFGAISVLTDFTMDYPEQYYDFFVEAGIDDIGFNIDEVEGGNTTSSFGPQASTQRYERFLERLLDRAAHHHGAVKIREIWTNLAALAFGGEEPVNNTNMPMRIINIDRRGDVTTFCPELVTSGITMGNVLVDRIDEMLSNPVFQRVSDEIATGVQLCRQTCQYWRFCGGGSPSNKFFEHGRFDVAETRTCQVHKKATVDVLLRHLERRTGLGPGA
ncbi:GRRM system radical SAM/SPASM domain protein [Catellatospora sp. KI3]|uniref:cyclophane-forming radical SAM/SPASM peptide maturase GrrM/OscB n=1 Tax=Catellatospora sp. KI3 TaxID=3041620 RepID=UPI0024824FB9|nr:cyclophane-forming radical SAM/SPASM peptide maturase GrrM/OscB [Catellatospora sp. KI3]MDI1465402.1 GRRM system radical SAM/SPASM domain protein [Catellatospora sp. KI3]